MLNHSPASRSKLTLPNCSELAKETGFVVRESSKFCPSKFVQSLLSSVSSGQGSYNQIASELGIRTGNSMSRQAMEKRFSPACIRFLNAVSEALLEEHFSVINKAFVDGVVKRILIEDSSTVSMPKSNAENFPAHGNHYGQTAGVKFDFAYDLISGSVISHTIHGATEQDKTIGKECLIHVEKGDLVLRDMGYFSLSEFLYIEEAGAFWLTRLPLTTGVVLPNNTSLEKHLKSFKKNTVDLIVKVGAEEKQCRLVAIRADKSIAAQRRRDRRKYAKEKGSSPCPKGLIRDGWHIMLTNLEKSEATADQLATVYRSRWGIEIQFRAWKQALNFSDVFNRTSKEFHMMALAIAGMIAHLLGMRMGQIFARKIGLHRLSYEKLYDLLAAHYIKALDLNRIADFNPDIRHISRDVRKRQSPIVTGKDVLS